MTADVYTLQLYGHIGFYTMPVKSLSFCLKKVKTLKFTEVQFCLLFCMGAKLESISLRENVGCVRRWGAEDNIWA
jgi:hypothetical protein